MYDIFGMEQAAREARRPLTERELELFRFLREHREEQKSARTPMQIRRRLATAIVGLGLKLDPEAVSLGRRVAMEAAHVRD